MLEDDGVLRIVVLWGCGDYGVLRIWRYCSEDLSIMEFWGFKDFGVLRILVFWAFEDYDVWNWSFSSIKEKKRMKNCVLKDYVLRIWGLWCEDLRIMIWGFEDCGVMRIWVFWSLVDLRLILLKIWRLWCSENLRILVLWGFEGYGVLRI